MATPSIACIGIIGKHVNKLSTPISSAQILTSHPQDNPLHIALFAPYDTNDAAYLEFSFLLNASIDIFEARTRDSNRVDQDLGMLQAVDESLSIWGWQTGTGTRLAIIINAAGRGVERSNTNDSVVRRAKAVGDGDVRVVSGSFDICD